MATVTGYTAAKMLEFINEMVVGAHIDGDNLILDIKDGSTIDAGNVRGPIGYGSAEIHNLSSISSSDILNSDEMVLYNEALSQNVKATMLSLSNVIKRIYGTNGDQPLYVGVPFIATNKGKTVMTYGGDGSISTVKIRNNADTADVMTATFGYTSSVLTSVSVVTNDLDGGRSITYTLNYTGGRLTSITKA